MTKLRQGQLMSRCKLDGWPVIRLDSVRALQSPSYTQARGRIMQQLTACNCVCKPISKAQVE